jgi:hypothetical protein
LALVASSETNNLRRINGLNSSTPAASTISKLLITHKLHAFS